MKHENENGKYVFIGKPNAGKGSLQKLVLDGRENDFEFLSVGNLLRKARKEETELGKKAAPYMDAGKLVPDEIICGVAIDGFKSATKPMISDGFPRSIPQAQFLLDAGVLPTVIEFYVDDEVVRERAQNREVCENCGATYSTKNEDYKPTVAGICNDCGGKLIKRNDDKPEVVEKRLVEYAEKTQPVIDFFKANGVTVHTIDTCKSDAAELLREILGL